MLNATCRLVVRQRSVAMDPWILDPQTAGETQNFLESTPLSFLRAGPPNFRRISAESRAHPNFDKKFAKLGPRPNRGTGSSSPGQMGIGTLTHESIRCSMARLSHAVPFLSTNATRFGQKAASRLSFLAAYDEACEDERWPQISTRGTELCLRCCNSSLTKAAARTKMPDPTAW